MQCEESPLMGIEAGMGETHVSCHTYKKLLLLLPISSVAFETSAAARVDSVDVM
jgi:hypothetical protein